ncbi:MULTISPECIES: peptide-methionine (S)-S-oxide reductase MsrA [unclassified Pseudactinotalea]|uniref:peptide-methionine (S)-S-oxide reductase MsrA n=1 Tax=unclassified Pseudactinotalea TaxID=2649176 RepID=UPI00128E742A|nr:MULTISPECIES: peptide-methionine (S)-S-oxide reductase MsrA [unclassified Pseudactinotalea]MPV48721.1 peptide-methionine (S)-S-oxide reductase MsrA [Pseudactinotalea sp. HY160]QGH68712.1 peptide-methionine (S)-S-oxide reductase MsrA [Pseudactinotalea sp. HY158]
MFATRATRLVSPSDALPGRAEAAFPVPRANIVLGTPLLGPWPEGTRTVVLAMGCFWGAERIFWRLDGVVGTAVGYAGGHTPNPTYEEVCTGRTGHTEAVLVAYDPARVGLERILREFWENHDPTQGFRQGNDRGTQYRSAIYWSGAGDEELVRASREAFNAVVREHGHPDITTELRPAADAGPFYPAEGYHQQYLEKNPNGYCNHGPNGMTCPVGILRQDELPAQRDVRPPAGA